MNLVLTVLAVLVIWEVVAGQALFARRTTVFRDGLESYGTEPFVYREENPVAFWIVICIQSVVLAYFFWRVSS